MAKEKEETSSEQSQQKQTLPNGVYTGEQRKEILESRKPKQKP